MLSLVRWPIQGACDSSDPQLRLHAATRLQSVFRTHKAKTVLEMEKRKVCLATKVARKPGVSLIF
jgi:hypothetical protein